jgi:hypothetical protein
MQEQELAPGLVHNWPARRACPNRQAIDVIDRLSFHALILYSSTYVRKWFYVKYSGD